MNRRIIIAIAVLSVSVLSFEITLLRNFSISLWYHFAFMVISIAMLGIGAGGAILALLPGMKELKYLPLYSLLAGTAIPITYCLTNIIPFDPARLAWDRVQLLYISLYYLLLLVPFLFYGLVISTAFSRMKEYAGIIYGADLAGAATGSVLALLLMHGSGTENAIFIISSIALLSSIIYKAGRLSVIPGMLIILNLFILYINPSFIKPRVSPYKPLQIALKYPDAEHLSTYYSPFSRVDLFRSPAVRFAPGLSLGYLEPIPEQTGISVDAGQLQAITTYTSAEELSFISHLPSSLAYKVAPANNILIIDPGGGLSVLTARFHNARNIFTVESNPTVLKAVRNLQSGDTKGIYNQRTWSMPGRSWLKSNNRKFDIMDISIRGTAASINFGFSEDYRYTVEAFTEYLEHLRPEGIISVNLYIIPPPRMELRLLNTLYKALMQSGLKDPSSHIAAIRSWGTITIIVRKTPLTENDISSIREFTGKKRFDLLYYPGITKGEAGRFIRMQSDDYYNAFNLLTDPFRRHRFIQEYLFDISPVSDDNPFYYYFLKFGKMREIYRTMGGKWQYFLEEGYLLPLLFLQVLALSVLLILLPAVRLKLSRAHLPHLSYFALLGLGFMFVEITLIQRMILPLENPAYAVSAVIFSLLTGAGLGSLLTHRFSALRRPAMLPLLGLAVILYSFIMPSLTETMLHLPLPLKALFVFLMLIPVAFLMGIPFPSGLYLLGRERPLLIPWAWVVNGSFSVLAPILAVMLAISTGYRVVLISGAFIYVLAFILFSIMRREGG